MQDSTHPDDVRPLGSAPGAPQDAALLAAIVASATDYAILTFDTGRRVTTWNVGAENVLGWTAAEAIGKSSDIIFTPEDRARGAPQAEADKARRDGRAEDERWHLRRDGSRFWASGVLMPLQGGAEGFLKILRDRTAERRTEEALRESEERFRQFAENSADVLWIVDAASVRLEYLNPAYERIWGEPRDAVLGDLGHWAERLHPDDRERAAAGMPRLLAGETVVNDYRIVRPDGAVRWIRDTGFPIRGEDGRVRRIAGVAQDVTADKEHERRQTLLMAELQHRVKNILANIRALSDRTAARSHTLDQFMEGFGGRLDALARTQALITRNPEGRAALADIVAQELAAYDGGNVAVRGPDVTLKAQKAQALHLAVHELATNAAKYGAFSTDEGRLDVSWDVERPDGAAQPWLRLSWRETGVAVADTAPPRGFGSEMIEDSLPYMLGGEASLAFHRDGVEGVIAFPLDPKDCGHGGRP